MKNIQYLLLGMALLISAAGMAQDNRLTLGINYSVAVPQGSSKDVVSKTSYLGFSAALMYHFNNQFSLGLESGSQAFYQKYPRQLYKTTDGGDLSGVISNNVETVPVLLKAKYSLVPNGTVQPFVSLAAGGSIINYNQYAGEFSNDGKTKFAFAARPELGLYVPFRKGSNAGFSISGGYNYMPFNYNGINHLNSIYASAGVSFPLGN